MLDLLFCPSFLSAPPWLSFYPALIYLLETAKEHIEGSIEMN